MSSFSELTGGTPYPIVYPFPFPREKQKISTNISMVNLLWFSKSFTVFSSLVFSLWEFFWNMIKIDILSINEIKSLLFFFLNLYFPGLQGNIGPRKERLPAPTRFLPRPVQCIHTRPPPAVRCPLWHEPSRPVSWGHRRAGLGPTTSPLLCVVQTSSSLVGPSSDD